jgi:hypothetical protein
MQKISIKRQNSPFPSFGKKTPHVQKKGGCDELFFSLSLSLSLGKDDERGRAIGESAAASVLRPRGLFFSRKSGSCRLFFLRRVRKKRRK